MKIDVQRSKWGCDWQFQYNLEGDKGKFNCDACCDWNCTIWEAILVVFSWEVTVWQWLVENDTTSMPHKMMTKWK